MVKVVSDNSYCTVIEIYHYIPEFDLEHLNLPKEVIVGNEIEIMEEELKRNYPDFHLVYSYPQRKIMRPPQDKTYEKAISNLENYEGMGKCLKVITRAVRYKHL